MKSIWKQPPDGNCIAHGGRAYEWQNHQRFLKKTTKHKLYVKYSVQYLYTCGTPTIFERRKKLYTVKQSVSTLSKWSYPTLLRAQSAGAVGFEEARGQQGEPRVDQKEHEQEEGSVAQGVPCLEG